CMANFSQGGLAQSFIPGMPVSAGAGIKLISASNGLNVDLSLWDGLPNGGGTMLASGTTITSGDVWVDVFWDTPADVTIGDTYYIVIEGDFANPCIAGDTNNPYPDGMVFANNYGSFPTFDYTFRTYGCDGGGSGGDCEVANPTNPGGVDNGYNIAVDAGFGVATDVLIPADENFIIDHVVINVLSNAGIGTVDINYYSDNAGLPGTIVGSEAGIVP